MLIFAAIVAIFVYGMIAAMLGTILPNLSDRFRLTPTQNGTIAFAQALGLIIASIGVGPLLDSEGKKIGLILGLALIAFALYALPRSPGFRGILFLFFLLGVGRRHRRHWRQCARQRRRRRAPRHGHELGQSLLRPRRAGHALHFRQSLQEQLGPPLLHRRIAHRDCRCHSVRHRHASSRRQCALPPRRCRARPRPAAALHARPLSLPLHHLRSRRLELAATPSHRPGHPRVARAQYPFAGLRARPARSAASASRPF